jgi:spectinomycin phosphotransferase
MHGTTLMKGVFPQAEIPFFRKEIGKIIGQLHQIPPADDVRLYLPVEEFSKFQAESKDVLRMTDQSPSDSLLTEFASFLNRWRSKIERLIAEAQERAEQLRSQQLEFVLCHGDIHEDNVLITDEDELYIIDWDEMILAPRERDVMFFCGDGLNDYLEGYRRHAPDYRLNQDPVDYYTCIFEKRFSS